MGANLLDGAGAIYDKAIATDGGAAEVDEPVKDAEGGEDEAGDRLASLQTEADDEPVVEGEGEAEGAEGAEGEEIPTRSEELIAEIDDVLKMLDEKAAAPPDEKDTPEGDEAEAPEDLKPLLEHDDPTIQAYARREIARREREEARIAPLEADYRERQQARQAEPFDVALGTLAKAHGFNELEMRGFVAAMTDNSAGDALTTRLAAAAATKAGGDPKKLASLVVESGAELLFGKERLTATKAKAGTAPKDGAEGSRPVIRVTTARPEKGTVETRGGSAGQKPARETVPPNESMEAAIQRVGRRHFRS